jgi:hypothetical protein
MNFFTESIEHINWVDPDNIILANSDDFSYRKMTSDVQENGVTQIRHIRVLVKGTKNTYKNYFRYIVDKESNWFYISNDDTRNGTYYTYIYPTIGEEIKELNSLYKKFDREDKLNQLFK